MHEIYNIDFKFCDIIITKVTEKGLFRQSFFLDLCYMTDLNRNTNKGCLALIIVLSLISWIYFFPRYLSATDKESLSLLLNSCFFVSSL